MYGAQLGVFDFHPIGGCERSGGFVSRAGEVKAFAED